jgi:hypothetical protein
VSRRWIWIVCLSIITWQVEAGAGCSTRRFPEWRVAPLTMLGVWEASPAVVVGEVRNRRAVGRQEIQNPPWPVASTINRIYWCEAEFSAFAAIKGKLPSRKRYFWGSVREGCKMDDLPPNSSRVWFIREEGDFIRPVVDGGGRLYLTFSANWDSNLAENPQIRFASLLLTPSAMSATLSEFAQGFDDPASTACFIIGRQQCTERIRSLSNLGDAALQRAACEFLHSQFQEDCN